MNKTAMAAIQICRERAGSLRTALKALGSVVDSNNYYVLALPKIDSIVQLLGYIEEDLLEKEARDGRDSE